MQHYQIVQKWSKNMSDFLMFSNVGMYFKNKQAIMPTDICHKRGAKFVPFIQSFP